MDARGLNRAQRCFYPGFHQNEGGEGLHRRECTAQSPAAQDFFPVVKDRRKKFVDNLPVVTRCKMALH
jgi:hypothetical protein